MMALPLRRSLAIPHLSAHPRSKKKRSKVDEPEKQPTPALPPVKNNRERLLYERYCVWDDCLLVFDPMSRRHVCPKCAGRARVEGM